MSVEETLAKTNRMNLLFDFYRSLLTEKQQTFMQCYFHDDLSLGEIAAEFEISRQAVYEHIKRAEQMLEDYESKLKLLSNHELRTAYGEQLGEMISRLADEEQKALLAKKLDEMMQI